MEPDRMQNEDGNSKAPGLLLLEFDDRFGALDEYVHYDYRKPLELPGKPQSTDAERDSASIIRGLVNVTKLGRLRGQFDRIICDPPFLSTECQTKGEFIAALGLLQASDSPVLNRKAHWY